jgi:YVTN family beta-propeller protein
MHGIVFLSLSTIAILLFSLVGSAYAEATVPVGKHPKDVAVNPKTNLVYVANFDNVAVIDGATNTVTHTIPIGGANGWAIKVNPNSSKVYVAGYLSNSVHVIDANSNTVINTIPLGERLAGIAINSKTNTVYAASDLYRTGGAITVIDGSDDAVIENIDLRATRENNGLTAIWPSGIAVDEERNLVYVGGGASSAIVVIDGSTNKITDRIERDGDFRRMVVDPSTGTLYAGNVQYGTVDVIRGHGIDSIKRTDGTALNYPQAIDINPKTGRIYVSDSNSVSVTGGIEYRETKRIQVDGFPLGIAVNPETNMIYVANFDADSISVIDGSTDKVVLTTWSVWPEIATFGTVAAVAGAIILVRRSRFGKQPRPSS